MSRRTSFIVLAAATVAVGVLFFRVIWPFVFSLLFAGVLALLFRPVYQKMTDVHRGHSRLAALSTTVLILTIVIVPIVGATLLVARELAELRGNSLERPGTAEKPKLDRTLSRLHRLLSEEEFTALREGVLAGQSPTSAVPSPGERAARHLLIDLEIEFSQEVMQQELRDRDLSRFLSPSNPQLDQVFAPLEPFMSDDEVRQVRRSTLSAAESMIANILNGTPSLVGNVLYALIAAAVMAVGLYYFFADGPQIGHFLRTVVPLEDTDTTLLYDQFVRVCRGVVLGTLAAALLQAALVAIGMLLVGVGHVWLLAGLAFIFSMIPFLGAAAVYLPVAVYLFAQQEHGAGLFLSLYGVGLVSTSDNLVRAHVIHGSSRLHPLVALVSVLGGIRFIGLWGVFLGPIIAAIFSALLQMVHTRLETPGGDGIDETREV